MSAILNCIIYLLVSLLSLLIILPNTELGAATNPCGNPLDYLLLNLINSDYGAHSQISVFTYNDTQYNGLYYGRPKEDYKMFSLAVTEFRMNSFFQEFYLDKNNRSIQSIALVVPSDLNEALEIFNQINLVEKEIKIFDGRKPQIFIVMPDTCTNSNCFADKILNSSVELPPISTEIYFLQCHTSTLEGFWNLSVTYSVGYNRLFQAKNMEFNGIFNPYSIRGNFSNATLRTSIPVAILKEEFSYLNTTGKVQPVSGLSTDVITYLEKALNFRTEYLIDGSIKKADELSWLEKSRQLLENDTLQIVSAGKITFLPIRKQHFSFLVPHSVEGVQAFFRQPPASSMRNIFKEPFRLDLWGTIVVVWFLVGFSAVLAARIKAGYEQLDNADREISKDSLLWAIAFTCQQGWHIDPESISIKIIFLCGSIMGLIVYVAYSAALVSALSSVVIPVKNFDDLLYGSDFVFYLQPESQTIEAILNGSENYENGQGGDEISAPEVLLLRSKTVRNSDSIKGVEKVFTSNVACLGFSDFFYSIAKHKLNTDDLTLCSKITNIKVSKVPFRSGMAVKKMSPYKDFLNIRLAAMYENGLMRRFQINYSLEFLGSCDKQRHKTDLGLGLNDVFTAYVIILSGYALSFVIFLIEKFYFKKYQIHQESPMDEGHIDVFDPHIAY